MSATGKMALPLRLRDIQSVSEGEFPFAKLNIDNSLRLAGVTILYYDHFITFGEEYRYIWKSIPSGAAILFLLNRYFAFLVNITVLGGTFHHYDSITRCEHFSFWRQVMIMVSQVIVGAVQLLRVYALYGRSKKIIWLILSIAAVLLGFSIWAVTGQSSEISLQEGCQFASSRLTAIHIVTAWEALFTFDLMIFCLTIARTYKTRIHYYGVGRKMDLVTLMVRDGAMYFGVMVLVQGANVVTYYAASPVLRGILSTLASDVSVTMMSRLMLNLHRIATGTDQTDVFGTTLDPTSAYTTHNGSTQFTTGESSYSISFGSGSRSRRTSERTGGEPYGHMRMPVVRVRGGGRDVGLGSSDLSTEGEVSLEMKDFTGVGRSFGSA